MFSLLNKYINHKNAEIMTNFLGCGDVARRVMGALNICGIKSRLVAVHTKEPYDLKHDGHTLLEIQTVDGWYLYDAFIGVCFRKSKRIIRLAEICNHIQNGDYEIDIVGNSELPKKIFDMKFMDWLKRVYQVPMIYDGKKFYTSDKETAEKNKVGDYVYITKDEWLDKFYRKY